MSSEIPLKNRRSQLERSDAMRVRLIEATIQCLINEGYAGTTISKIIETAQVSRGAPMHHFSSKAALIEATAEHLMQGFYKALSRMFTSIDASDDRLNDLIMSSWRNLLVTPQATAILELLVASRHEPELAAIMQKLWVLSYRYTRLTAKSYLEPVSEEDSVGDLIVLTQWLLRGMAEDRHINAESADANIFFERYLKLWVQVLASHIRGRVNTKVDTNLEKPNSLDSNFPKLDSTFFKKA